MTKVRISISLDKDLFEIIETKRGLVSRSGFIGFLLKRELKNDILPCPEGRVS